MSPSDKFLLLALAASLTAARPGQSRAAESARDKSAFTLFSPTPPELMREMSTDRPDTTESAFTVDAGHFQVETSLVDYSRDRFEGETVETLSFGMLNLKAGLTNSTDIQLVLEATVRETMRSAAGSSVSEGFGDPALRLKHNLWGAEGDGATAFALMPWISAPWGDREISAGGAECGLIAPLAFEVSEGVSGGLMLEADTVRSDTGYKIRWTHTATCGFELFGPLGMFVEYVGVHDSGSSAHYRALGDLGLNYAVNDNLILDTGVRVGLNNNADDFGWFAGMSLRH